MAQQHMDRLSSVDVSFLTNESASSHMHVGGIMIFEGPPPSYDDLLDHIRSRLHLVPRFRQKLAYPPAQTGRPFWVDDSNFNLEYHVRHSALPAPGPRSSFAHGRPRLLAAARPTKPLWELWLVQGLTRKRFALITKTHHALVDGVSGVDIATVLFDLKPVPEPAEPDQDWAPGARAVERHPGSPRASRTCCGRRCAPCAAWSARSAPADAVREVAEAVEGVGEIGWAFANPAPKVPLNVEIGSHRRFTWVRSDLAQMKRIKDALGGTVNDVVLAVVAGAIRDWLHASRHPHRGARAAGPGPGLDPRRGRARPARQPAGGDAGAASRLHRGSRPPPPGRDPGDAGAQAVQAGARRGGDHALQRLRPAHPARAGGADQLLDPPLQPGGDQCARARRCPLYVLGRELEDIFPVGFLPPHQALFVAIMSYNGGINFGLLADYDSMDDLELIAGGSSARSPSWPTPPRRPARRPSPSWPTPTLTPPRPASGSPASGRGRRSGPPTRVCRGSWGRQPCASGSAAPWCF